MGTRGIGGTIRDVSDERCIVFVVRGGDIQLVVRGRGPDPAQGEQLAKAGKGGPS